MSCCNCAKWQGTRYSHWADCHYICHVLNPDMYKVQKRNGFMLLPPHDPHDQKYVEEMPKLMRLDDGVRIQMQREEDVVYDSEGNERRKFVRLPFYQTHRHFECEVYTPSP